MTFYPVQLQDYLVTDLPNVKLPGTRLNMLECTILKLIVINLIFEHEIFDVLLENILNYKEKNDIEIVERKNDSMKFGICKLKPACLFAVKMTFIHV